MSYVNYTLQKGLRAGNQKTGRKLGKQFPDMWVTGPDPWLHDEYYTWLKHKSQAAYRGEEYQFTWDDWQHHWHSDSEPWRQRGRARDDLILTRIDHEGAWSRVNCHIISRLEHLRATIRRNHEHRRKNTIK
jgi:hypothetical protein